MRGLLIVICLWLLVSPFMALLAARALGLEPTPYDPDFDLWEDSFNEH